MEIEKKIIEDFGDLNSGDCFMIGKNYNSDKDVFMKIEIHRGVNLESGKTKTFEPGHFVRKVNAKVIIEN